MSKISAQQVQELRNRTGASISHVKKALEEANGNEAEALKILKLQGQSLAEKKTSRETKAGVVTSYVHGNDRVGVLVALRCETDFVARNEEFKKLAHELALQIAATNPAYIKPEDIPEAVVAEDKAIFEEQAKGLGKPEKIMNQFIEGKIKSRFAEICLLNQAYIRNPDQTISELIKEYIAKLGENIEVAKFYRLEI